MSLTLRRLGLPVSRQCCPCPKTVPSGRFAGIVEVSRRGGSRRQKATLDGAEHLSLEPMSTQRLSDKVAAQLTSGRAGSRCRRSRCCASAEVLSGETERACPGEQPACNYAVRVAPRRWRRSSLRRARRSSRRASCCRIATSRRCCRRWVACSMSISTTDFCQLLLHHTFEFSAGLL